MKDNSENQNLSKGVNWAAAGVLAAAVLGGATLFYTAQKDAQERQDEAAKLAADALARDEGTKQKRQADCASFIMLGKQFWKNSVLLAQSLPQSGSFENVRIDQLGKDNARKALDYIEEYERKLQVEKPTLNHADYLEYKSYYDDMHPTSLKIMGALRGSARNIESLTIMNKTGRHQRGESFTMELERYCQS